MLVENLPILKEAERIDPSAFATTDRAPSVLFPKTVGRLAIYSGTSAIERWKYLLQVLPGSGLFHSMDWIELLRSAYGLRFVVAELQARGRVLAALLMAHPYPSWWSNRLCSLPFSDFCPPLEAEAGAALTLMDQLAESGYATRYEVRGAYAGSPWQVIKTYLHWQADCHVYEKSLDRAINATFRREVRAGAEQGLTIERGRTQQFFDRYYRLQLQTRQRLGLPSQPRHFFRHVHRLFGSSGMGEVWIASKAGVDHVGVVLLSEPEVLHFKWGARGAAAARGANHFLHWHIIEQYHDHYRKFDFGRTGASNDGLSRWKRHIGGKPSELGYCYLPVAPKVGNSEDLSGAARMVSRFWGRLPLPVTEMIGTRLYRFLG